jgi:flagellar basal body-associated protein FliL
MNKLVTAGVIILAIAVGCGATFGVMHFMQMGGGAAHAHEATAKTADDAHPKPIYFADLSGIVVSIPPQAGAPATSYVQIGLQFSTHDQKALESFNTLQPIIQSQIISLLMSETSSALQNPTTRAQLIQGSLDAANGVLAKNSGNPDDKPFDAAYITNLVVQD